MKDKAISAYYYKQDNLAMRVKKVVKFRLPLAHLSFYLKTVRIYSFNISKIHVVVQIIVTYRQEFESLKRTI